MTENNQEKVLFNLADQFINLANDLVKQDNSGLVGVALRYAAARYSAFEASLGTDDLERDKLALLDLYLEDYRKMLEKNFHEYAGLASRK